MMQSGLPLRGPYLKLERAAQLMDTFRSQFREWVNSKPYAITEDVAADGPRVYYAERRHPFPEMLGCIIADALHNLRSALDHVAFTLIKDVVEITNSNVLDNVHFPIASDVSNFEGTVAARLASGLYCTRVADFFRKHQPYVGGIGERIYTLNRLDRFDKHCDLIDVQARDTIRISWTGAAQHFTWHELSEKIELQTVPGCMPEKGGVFYSMHFRSIHGVRDVPVLECGGFLVSVTNVVSDADETFFR